MSRDDGFPHADVDVGFLSDPKLRVLRRGCPDEGEYAATVLVYTATLLASWREGRQLSAAEAEQDVRATDERVDRLRRAGLLDDDGCIPDDAWDRWYGTAWDRREAKRKSGRERSRRHRDRNASQTSSDASRSSSNASPKRVTRHIDDVTPPSYLATRLPTSPTGPNSRAREVDDAAPDGASSTSGKGLEALQDVMKRIGRNAS